MLMLMPYIPFVVGYCQARFVVSVDGTVGGGCSHARTSTEDSNEPCIYFVALEEVGSFCFPLGVPNNARPARSRSFPLKL